MILPATKLFKVIKGTTFDYRFQYLMGNQSSSAPIPLTGYTAQWIITPPTGTATTYTTTLNGNGSGVKFGGDPADPTNGIIDLVISATDTAAIVWRTATHALVLTSPSPVHVTELMTGGMGVIGALPS